MLNVWLLDKCVACAKAIAIRSRCSNPNPAASSFMRPVRRLPLFQPLVGSTLKQAAPLVDIAFISAPGRDEKACVNVMRRWVGAGTKIVVVTRGEAGSVAMENDKVLRQGIDPVEVLDTFGAGDWFIAGFLVSYARHADVGAALAEGAASAAAACQLMGGYGHGAEHPWPIPDIPSPRHVER